MAFGSVVLPLSTPPSPYLSVPGGGKALSHNPPVRKSSRLHRLSHKRDFERLQRLGRTYRGQFLSLRLGRNQEGVVRVGFAIAKRLGKAVERNRLRRRLREVLRLSTVAPGWDILVIAREDAVHQNYHALKVEVEGLLRQAGALQEG